MIRIAYLIDTWTWVDYFNNPTSETSKYIDQDDHMLNTSTITISEIISIFKRRKSGAVHEEDIARAITGRSAIIPVDMEIAIKAGKYTKKDFPGGLGTRLILATGESRNLTIVTGDQHFKGKSGVAYLGK